MKLAVYNIKGEDTGKQVELDASVFGIEPNDHAIYLAVKQYLANKRQGTHKSKERADIKGSTRKIKRQKGTGTARAGSIKSPLFRGGGRVFGPEPRDYSFKLNKKLKRLARQSALAYKAKDNAIIVVEDFSFEAPKTKDFIAFEQNIKTTDLKSVLVMPETNKNVVLSARNLAKTEVVTADKLNTFQVLNCKSLVLTVSALESIEKNFKAEEA